jgi:hypothetical protein
MTQVVDGCIPAALLRWTGSYHVKPASTNRSLGTWQKEHTAGLDKLLSLVGHRMPFNFTTAKQLALNGCNAIPLHHTN